VEENMSVSIALKPDELLTPKEAAEILGVRPQTLATWRMTGRYGLRHLKVGRLVRYRRADLEAWLENRGSQPLDRAKPMLAFDPNCGNSA
jgi:excisionase family DNA binding protein